MTAFQPWRAFGVALFLAMAAACGGSDDPGDGDDGDDGENPGPSTGGGSGTGGGDPGPGSGGAVEPVTPAEGDWPSYEEARASDLSTKLLVVLMDFSDTDMDTVTPQAETSWARLFFGVEQGEGNHYWYHTSGGQFQLLPAEETNGTENDGLVRVQVSAARPTGSGVVTESQSWIPEALDALAASVDFSSFDENGDTVLQNEELSVIFILDVPANVLAYADAQANIVLNHSIAGAGVTLQKFARSVAILGAIGVPMHELGHHIFELNHFAGATDHDLMGQGSYASDPEIGNLHNPSYKSSTRPTGLMGLNAVLAGFMTATPLSDTTLGVELHSPELGKTRNVVTLPVKDGLLYLENRTNHGYDQSIPFCDGSSGGLFFMELSQYAYLLSIPGVSANLEATEYFEGERNFCEYYAHAGHNGTFEYGGWRFENISAAGPTMRLDIVKTGEVAEIDHYKLGYWVNDTTRVGYRRKVFKRIDEANTPNMDFAEMVDGHTTTTRFPVWLDAYYTTGEVRGVNAVATWVSDNPYVSIGIDGVPFTNEGALLQTAIAIIRYNTAQPHLNTANFTVSANGVSGNFTMSNIPAP